MFQQMRKLIIAVLAGCCMFPAVGMAEKAKVYCAYPLEMFEMRIEVTSEALKLTSNGDTVLTYVFDGTTNSGYPTYVTEDGDGYGTLFPLGNTGLMSFSDIVFREDCRENFKPSAKLNWLSKG